MRQVGTGKASVSEPLTTCRNKQLTSEPDRLNGSGMSLAGARLLARRCPAWRRRESGLRLLHGTWEGGCRHRRPGAGGRWGGKRERAVRRKPEALSTVAASAGGLARSSGEALVTGVERRGRLICRSVRANNRGLPWEEAGRRAMEERPRTVPAPRHRARTVRHHRRQRVRGAGGPGRRWPGRHPRPDRSADRRLPRRRRGCSGKPGEPGRHAR